MKQLLIFILAIISTLVTQAQNVETVDYQQRFKDAVAQLDSCQECAVQQLLEIKSAQYAPETVRINSTIVLANVSVSTGNIESLDVFLKDIEQYIAQHPDDKNVSSTLERLKGYRSELGKQQESFRDRLVGTWVTAEATTQYKGIPIPWIIIELHRRYDGSYTSLQINHFQGVETTDNIDIDATNKAIALHYGSEKIKEADTDYAKSLMNQVRYNATESAATKSRTGNSDWGKDLSNIFLTLMAKKASTAKANYKLYDYFLKEIAPNILLGKFFYWECTERSDGFIRKKGISRIAYLYRITPDDTICFTAPSSIKHLNRLDFFMPFKEIKKALPFMKKYSEIEWNLVAYDKLRNKIMKQIADLDKTNAEWISNELKYGPQGYAWNDGYYLSTKENLNEYIYHDHNDDYILYTYNEKYKGPYCRTGNHGWYDTIRDYWKTFSRDYGFSYFVNYEIEDFNNMRVPKYFKMKSDIDSKKNKKNKKKEEEDEE